MTDTPDARLDAPHFHRNWRPILDGLMPLLAGREGHALEVGCGSGQHAAAFAESFPDITWWPSDVEAVHRASADAWRLARGLVNHMPPVTLDATAAEWPIGGGDQPPDRLALIYSFNVIHIAPWDVAEGLAAGAGRHLSADGLWILYGPFKRAGRHTAPSNEAFDENLRRRNPSWGVRNLEDVEQAAAANGLRLIEILEMPANNLIVVFGR